MGTLGPMTGHCWYTAAVDMGAVTVNGSQGQDQGKDAAGWDAIDSRAFEEDRVRRTASCALAGWGDLPLSQPVAARILRPKRGRRRMTAGGTS
jgi:hypothetical protein